MTSDEKELSTGFHYFSQFVFTWPKEEAFSLGGSLAIVLNWPRPRRPRARPAQNLSI